MAIATRGSPTFTHRATTGGAVCTEPTGSTSGDVLVAHCLLFQNGDGMTAPSGWSSDISGGNSAVGGLKTFYIVRGGSAPTLTFTSTLNGVNVIISAYSGVDNVTPLDVAGSLSNYTTNQTAPTSPSLTTVTDNAWIICCLDDTNDTRTITVPSGHTQDYNVTANGAALSHELIASHGATGTQAWTLSSTGDTCICTTMALRPASSSTFIAHAPINVNYSVKRASYWHHPDHDQFYDKLWHRRARRFISF